MVQEVRRRVFVSYHHGGDQAYYDSFSRFYHDNLQLITDNSLERAIDSGSVDYVMRRIREEHLHGSSCTIVLCGENTPKRKYIDWEIYASLGQEMGLVGIGLPSISWYQNGGTFKPPRLQDNIDSKYAEWTLWQDLVNSPAVLGQKIEAAVAKSSRLISNSRQRMSRNG